MTYANQVRLLKLNIQSLASVIGQGLIAAVLPGIQALNALMTKLMQAATVFRDFMYVLMGKKIKGSQSGVVNDLAGLEDTSYDLSGIEDAGDSAADGLDNATSAAKDLKKALSVLPFDELNQLTDNSNDNYSGTGTGSSGTGSGGTGTNGLVSGLGDLLDDAYNVDEISPVNEWAAKIRKAFLAHDWEDLGKTVAEGINKGLQKVYDLFKWENAKGKIEPFITGFSETVNSLVRHINWTLMGKTIGAGIDTLAHSFNELVTKINFYELGYLLAIGLRGALNEISWSEIGNAIGNGFMVSWRIFGGFIDRLAVKDGTGLTGFQQLGKSVGTALNNAFAKISFKQIANYLTEGINGAFDALNSFVSTFEWEDFRTRLKDGIATAIQKIHWKENGQALSNFITELIDTINDMIDNGTVRKIGESIGTFLAQQPWKELLLTAAKAIGSGLYGLLKEIFLEGDWVAKVAAIIGGAFAIMKIADFTGLDKVGKLIATGIKAFLGTDENQSLIYSGIKALIGKATSKKGIADDLGDVAEAAGDVAEAMKNVGSAAETASSGGLSKIGSKLATLGGSGVGSFLAVGVGIAAISTALAYATSSLAGWVEKLQGGNGVGGTFGNTTNNLIHMLREQGDISSEAAKEITAYRESLETADMSSEEMKQATQDLVDKLSSIGVTKDQAVQALAAIEQQGGVTDDMLEILTDSIQEMSNETSVAAESIDLSTLTASDAYGRLEDSLKALRGQNVLTTEQWNNLDSVLMNAQSSSIPAQEAYNTLMQTMEDMGINTRTASDIIATYFPECLSVATYSATNSAIAIHDTVSGELSATSEVAKQEMSATKDAISDNMLTASNDSSTAAQQIKDSISSGTAAAAESASSNTSQIASDTASNLSDASSVASSAMKDIEDAATSKWDSSYKTTYQNLGWMKIAISQRFQEMFKTVESVMKSIYNKITQQWEYISKASSNTLTTMNANIGTKFNSLLTTVQNVASNITKSFSNMSSNIQRVFNNISSSISSAFGNMYTYGHNAAVSFANGFQSVHISTPHIYVSSYTKHAVGNSTFSTPNFGVAWYKTGGLFNAASVIGVGESGKEAVLPLENKKTMGMIANSIADASGGIGLSHEELSEAVAEGVAMAMMNNSSNSGTPEYAMVNISVGENEFARAITKVQNKYSSRMKPSPVF